MKIKKTKNQPLRKTWVALLKELLLIPEKKQAEHWLEREALNLVKIHKTYTVSGAKMLIKENMGALMRFYPQETQDKIKKLIGVSYTL